MSNRNLSCGRPPLPPPPSPSPTKPLVLGISTHSKLCGLTFCIVSRLEYQQYIEPRNNESPSVEQAASQTRNSSEQSPFELPESSSACNANGEIDQGGTASRTINELENPSPTAEQVENQMNTLPGSIQQLANLTFFEYQDKIDQFELLLHQCRAGYARTILVFWSIAVVVSFVAAYMTPQFWTSTFFTHPWFLLGFATTQMFVVTFLMWWSRHDIHRLVTETRNLFRPWLRQYGLQVSMYPVTHIMMMDLPQRLSQSNSSDHPSPESARPTLQRHRRRRPSPHIGSFNLVLVFVLVRSEDVEAIELASLDGTVDEEDDADE